MKKKILEKVILMGSLSLVSYTASIDWIQNNTSSYLGNPAQNANVSAENVFYNPAGLSKLEDGQYLNFNLQGSFIEESMELDGDKYDSNTFSPIPSINYVNKKGDLALYGNLSIAAGGPFLKYKDGVAGIALAGEAINNLDPFSGTPLGLNLNITGSEINGSNRYYQGIVGGAYNLNDKVSVSLGGRLVYAIRELDGYADLDYNDSSIFAGISGIDGKRISIDSKRDAFGYGGIIGLNFIPEEGTNLSFKYESEVDLDFKTDANEDDTVLLGGRTMSISTFYPEYADGDKRDRDLPAIFSIGLSKEVTDRFRLMGGFNYYFNSDADLDGEEYDNGYDFNIGMEYDINNKWMWMLGYNYANTGADPDIYDDTEYALNSNIYGTGFKYKPSEKHEFVFTGSYIAYESSKGVDTTVSGLGVLDKSRVTYDKEIFAGGLGYTYKF